MKQTYRYIEQTDRGQREGGVGNHGETNDGNKNCYFVVTNGDVR